LKGFSWFCCLGTRSVPSELADSHPQLGATAQYHLFASCAGGKP